MFFIIIINSPVSMHDCKTVIGSRCVIIVRKQFNHPALFFTDTLTRSKVWRVNLIPYCKPAIPSELMIL